MKRKLIILCCVGMLTIIMLSKTNNAYAIEGLKGNWSLGIYAALNNSTVETLGSDTYESNSTIVNASLGYFLTDHVELNFSPTMARNKTESFEMSFNNYFGNVKYNFYGSNWQAVPYIGLQGGVTKIDLKYEDENPDNSVSYDDTSYSFGFMGGIKVFLTENLSLDVEYNWLWSPDIIADLTMSTVFVGFKWYFGGN